MTDRIIKSLKRNKILLFFLKWKINLLLIYFIFLSEMIGFEWKIFLKIYHSKIRKQLF